MKVTWTQLEMFPEPPKPHACNNVGCARCAGGNLPHSGQEPPPIPWTESDGPT